ncbi:MAG: hypothetical protein EOM66_07565, partial [Clostridia bacterium]|nr:hypothetical protein [Clostridia bacterium]
MNKFDPISAAKRAHKKWSVLAICLAVVAVCILVTPLRIWFSKAFAALGSADVGAVISLIRSYGSWAAAISFLLMVLQSVAAPIPAFLLTLSNAAIFGWWQGAILSWSSAMAGASLCFFLARALGRDTVAKLIGRSSMGAVETFFERYGKHTILICRLLPFWQDVFKQCELEASYVIAIRHPLSVAKSLEARNSFDEEKVHYLWMNHVIPSILETTGALRVTVNYDRLMDQPVAEIFRVARALYLEDHINPGELAKFEKEFLEEKLRHSRYAVNTFSPGPTIPPGIIEIFALLEKTTSDELSLDDPTVLD